MLIAFLSKNNKPTDGVKSLLIESVYPILLQQNLIQPNNNNNDNNNYNNNDNNNNNLNFLAEIAIAVHEVRQANINFENLNNHHDENEEINENNEN